MSVSCKQELTLQLRRKIRTDLQTQKKRKANSGGVGPRKFMLTPPNGKHEKTNKQRTKQKNVTLAGSKFNRKQRNQKFIQTKH